MKLRTKLFVFNGSVVATLTILTLIIGQDFVRLANLPAQEESIKTRTLTEIAVLASQSEVRLAADDRFALKKQMAQYASTPDIAFVKVWDRTGTLVANEGQGPNFREMTSGKKPDQLQTLPDNVVAVWRPVSLEGMRMGSVAIGYSTSRVKKAQNRILMFTLLIIFAAAISLTLSLVFASRITRPLLQMTQSFRKMGEGHLGQEAIEVRTDDETGDLAHAFNELSPMLQQLEVVAKEIAKGNLSVKVEGNGDLAEAFRQMVVSQRNLVTEIHETAIELTSAASQFQTTAEKQERGAVEQSTAFEENRRTMESLIESGRKVSATAQGVLETAEKADTNSRLVSEHIATLSTHTQRIAEILQVIKEIANKSDVLALNAALEGTKAGEIGRGFSLVAAQMQRLAENVMASVRDIKELTDTVGEATRATVLATEESTKLAADTTRAARQISMTIHQQQAGTEEVTKTMEDVANIAREMEIGSKQVVTSSKDLVNVAGRLRSLVGQFETTIDSIDDDIDD